MLVRETMTGQVVTVSPQATLREAARLLARHSITAMPVVDDGGRLVGVLSEADVVRESLVPDQRAQLVERSVGVGPSATRVEEVMSSMPVTVRPDTDVVEAVELMTDTVVKSLPVVEHGRVVGVISRRDVVAVLALSDEQVESELDDLVRCWGRVWDVVVADGVVTFEGVQTAEDRRLARTLAGTVRGVVGVRFATEPARRRS